MSDDKISGPFNKEYIQRSCNGNTLIWGSNMPEWMNKSDWIRFLSNSFTTKHKDTSLNHIKHINAQHASKTDNSNTQLKPEKEPYQWFYSTNNEKFGPFDEDNLIQTLKVMTFQKPLYLWHNGLETWQPIEKFTSIYEKLSTISKAA